MVGEMREDPFCFFKSFEEMISNFFVYIAIGKICPDTVGIRKSKLPVKKVRMIY